MDLAQQLFLTEDTFLKADRQAVEAYQAQQERYAKLDRMRAARTAAGVSTAPLAQTARERALARNGF